MGSLGQAPMHGLWEATVTEHLHEVEDDALDGRAPRHGESIDHCGQPRIADEVGDIEADGLVPPVESRL